MKELKQKLQDIVSPTFNMKSDIQEQFFVIFQHYSK